MAITWGSIVGGYGRIGIENSVVNTNDTTVTVTSKVYFWSKYSVSDTSNTLYFDYNTSSATTSKGACSISTTHNSGSGWNTSNQKLLKTFTFTRARGTGAVTQYCAAKLINVDRVGGTMTVNASYSIPKKTSYIVSYNANGGSGIPSSQIKWYGTNLTLSSMEPTRTGFSFNGWNTASNGSGTNYPPGGTYSANASVALYAQWKAITYTVKYDANGGTGAPGNQTKTYGVNLTLSNTKPIRTNYIFKGWSLTKNGSVYYQPGGTCGKNENLTLYAVWELAYWVPKITNLKVSRCKSDGTADEFGESFKVSFNWECCQLLGTNPVSSIYWITQIDTSTEVNRPIAVDTTKTSGVVSVVGIGADDWIYMSTEATYIISVKVTDSTGQTGIKQVTLPATRFPVDFKAGGTGVAFGKPADTDNLFDVNFDAQFRKPVISIDPSGEAFLTKHGTSGKESWYAATRTDAVNTTSNKTNKICFGIGGGGQNRGMWTTNIMSHGSSEAELDDGWAMYVGSDGYIKSQRAEKILWSGNYYMTEGHTVTLAETVSKQLTGIVLVWSKYTDGAAQNTDFNTFFVPKQHVLNHNGKGLSCIIASSGFGALACKYVYVFNDKITGNATNINTGTKNGITYANNAFVLRYVIGV